MIGLQATDLMEDMRRLVSLVNWHLTFLLEHSEQEVVSVASHWPKVSIIFTLFLVAPLRRFGP